MTDVIPFPKQAKDLRRKIREIPDGQVVKRLEAYLDFFEAGWKLENQEDLDKLYGGIFEFMLYDLFPQKKGESFLKIINAAVQWKKAFLEVEFPEKVIKVFNEAIRDRDQAVLSAAQALMTPDNFARFREGFPKHIQIGELDGKCDARD
jgi:hypothetical protein